MGRQLAIGDFSTVPGDPAVAGRACGLRRQPGARSISFTDDRGVSDQPYPNNYRTEILAFMRTYLNNPVGVREAAMAEPVQRTVGGRLRYVSCLRYAAREADGTTAGSGSGRSSMSMAGSTASRRTPRSSVRARPMRRFRSWKS